jgi:DNA-binding transcriptional LysR family regulator
MADLNQLVVFAAVAREGSFTAAAKRLGQPKSTVSKRVAELEQRLGTQLLHRSTRRVRLTEEGAAYYERCTRIVREVEDADREMLDRDGAPRGLVRLTAPPQMAPLLAPIVHRLLSAYPELALDLVLTDRRVDVVQEGFDIALRAGPLRDSSLVARRLGASRRVVVAHPRYLAARGTPRRPADLVKHDCIVTGDREWTFERSARRVTVTVGGRYRVTSIQLAREGALAQHGIASIPRFMVEQDLAARRLVVVLPAWPLRAGEVHLLYGAAPHTSPRVRVVIEHCVAAFAGLKDR